jgi:hypothetical protein
MDAWAEFQQTGAKGLFQSDSWHDLQSSQTTYTLGSLTSVLDSTPQQTLLVNLKVIDTTNKTTPTFLMNSAFNSAGMKTAFHRLIDQLAPHLKAKVKYLAVGNEVDVWLSQNPTQWAAYTAFYADAVSYIHTALPGVQVGVTSTYDGYMGADRAHLVALNAYSDVWIATYYPVDGHFVPRAPDVALTELPQLVSLAGAKPMVLQEVGYPSAASLGSSEQAQARFVSNVFQVWQTMSAQVPFLNYVMQHDVTMSVCQQAATYYGVAAVSLDVINWEAYYCSLGLRNATGTAKVAWGSFLTASTAFTASQLAIAPPIATPVGSATVRWNPAPTRRTVSTSTARSRPS